MKTIAKATKTTKEEFNRKRINITLTDNAHGLGQSLAEQDKRDFSYELEWLIESEWRRRHAAD